MRRVWLGVSALSLSVLGLAAPAAYAQGVPTATAELRDAGGRMVGRATFTQQAGGVRIAVQVQGLPAGQHGIHVHEAGRCDPPDFATAGGHFNPESRQHGLENPQGPHAGDLPNLTVAANGAGSFNAVDPRITLGSGPNSLFGPNGTALVIHAMPDDEMTDPAGNSGPRIVCGTILRGPGALPATGGSASVLAGHVALLAPVAAGAAVIAAGALRLFRRRR